MEFHGVSKDLARTSKVKKKCIIYTKRGWKMQMREKSYSSAWDRYSQKMEYDTL